MTAAKVSAGMEAVWAAVFGDAPRDTIDQSIAASSAEQERIARARAYLSTQQQPSAEALSEASRMPRWIVEQQQQKAEASHISPGDALTASIDRILASPKFRNSAWGGGGIGAAMQGGSDIPDARREQTSQRPASPDAVAAGLHAAIDSLIASQAFCNSALGGGGNADSPSHVERSSSQDASAGDGLVASIDRLIAERGLGSKR
jgi:hypothetical protein